MKRNFSVLLLFVLILGFVSCDSTSRKSSSDQKMQAQTEQLMKEADSQIGMPAITNFQEKKLMKMIYELRDKEDLVCFAYIVDMHGNLHFIGKCLGYGLPYSTQFSNPEKTVSYRHQLGYSTVSYEGLGTLPQPEPNGLFMPEGLSATWLLLLDDDGEPRPTYIEPEILVSPIKLH